MSLDQKTQQNFAKQKLVELAPKINAEIEKILKDETNHSSPISEYIKDLLPRLLPLAEGGKKIRGALAYYSYFLNGGTNERDILKVAAVIELIHTFILIHDDVIDRDSLRRGYETVHSQYKKLHKDKEWRGDPTHFGYSVAICTGDILNNLSYEHFLKTSFKDNLKLKALQKFNRQIVDTGYGEMLDVVATVRDQVTEKDILRIHHYKTGIYTYETPLHIGAILAEASENSMKTLSGYAIPTGITYQLQDDILGMFGDEKKLGKPADSDLKEGKQTLLIIKALEKASDEEKSVIDSVLGNEDLTKADHDRVKKIITSTGSLDYSKQLATKYIKKAKKILDNYTEWEGLESQNRARQGQAGREGEKFLKSIADYMLTREF